MNTVIVKQVQDSFRKLFKEEPLVVRSPGRVNIIGEHTDYNEGFVLPAAIDKAIYVAIAPRKDAVISLYSEDFGKKFECPLTGLKPSKEVWPNYILGVVDQLQKKGMQLGGFNLVLGGDVPIGSGLSSSAAVECATAFGLNHLFKLSLTSLALAQIGQKAEHEFAGVMVGIMDEFASVFGKKGHVIKLDCRSLQYEYVPLKMEGFKILLLNSNVEHLLASTEYNTRRQQCQRGVEIIQHHLPPVQSLRDVSLNMLDQWVQPQDELVYKRCRYVIEENERLLGACEDLKRGDMRSMGKKMFRSHEGLSKEYEVSCKELDFLVEAVSNKDEVVGARMMGGGFGGCTINIVKQDAIEPLIKELASKYKTTLGKDLSAYVAEIEDGTSIVSSHG
ncbi:MAG: galactokinase [Flavisolibacter sp.]